MKNLTIITIVLLCLSILSSTKALSQQGKTKSSRKTENVSRPAKSESTDVEEQKVIKQAKDHDVEEAEHYKNPANRGTDRVKKTGKNKDEFDSAIQKGTEKAQDARSKIDDAKQKLERDRKAGKISDEDYKLQKEKIEKAEKAVNELEKNIKEGKELQ